MIANLRTLLPDQIKPIGDGISFVVAILLDIALFMALYSLLPHGTSTWRDILPGAIGAGLLWELAKKGFFALYLHPTSLSTKPDRMGQWQPFLGLPDAGPI